MAMVVSFLRLPLVVRPLTVHASFWINLPFGGIALAAVYFFFHPPPRKVTGMTVYQRIREIDIAGAFFLICGMGHNTENYVTFANFLF